MSDNTREMRMNYSDLYIINLFFVTMKEVLRKYKNNEKLTERERFLCIYVIVMTIPPFRKLQQAAKDKRLTIKY